MIRYDNIVKEAVDLSEDIQGLFNSDEPIPGNEVLRLIKLQEALLSFMNDEK